MYKRKLRDEGGTKSFVTSDDEGTKKRKRGLTKNEMGSSEDEPDFGKHYSDSSRDELPAQTSIRYGQLFLDCIYNLTEGGRSLWEMFDVLPSREDYPDYYQIIKEPVDLQCIRQKFQDDVYTSLGEMERDILLMVKNAHSYNETRSQIYKDATTIKKAILNKKFEIERSLYGAKSSDRTRSRSGQHLSADSDADSTINDDESISNAPLPEGPTSSRKDDGTIRDGGDDVQVDFYNTVLMFSDETGRVLSEPFLRLPSKRAYPEYYEIIQKPMALLKIRAKIKAGSYDSLDAVEEEMNQVFLNAQTFNEDESLLHKDAVVLQNVMFQKKIQILKAEGSNMDQNRKQRPKILEDGTPHTIRKKREIDPKVLRKRMKHLLDSVVAYKDETGRILSEIFMELPSPVDYPEYYKYIKNPIDLKSIEANIKTGKYPREDVLMRDFDTMFLNAKHFNEEDSQVYKDAVVLEKMLKRARKALGPVYGDSSAKQSSPVKSGKSVGSPGSGRRLSGTFSAPNHSQALLNHIKYYKDSSGRVLCGIFEHLPSKSEYPDYYVLIKKPIDLSKISSNVETNKYATLDDLEQDLLLMFDNACRYNEPDSQIYKDALTLQREMIQKKTELLGFQADLIPDVPHVAQRLLKQLFDKVIERKDDEGRCYSDSLLEVQVTPEVGEHENKRRRPVSLVIIGKLLEKGFYKRLDRLQDDLFAIFHKAREISRTDSEMYEDAVELHQYFIAERDIVCKDGQKFVSQALGYGKRQFQLEIEEERKMKHEKEFASDEEQKGDERGKDPRKDDVVVPSDGEVIFLNEVTLDDDTYRLGDFVYVESREGKKPHIVLIEKIWTNQEGNRGVHCCWFYRPEETFHLASRKFLEQEVFRSDHYGHISLDRIVGKCYVLHVKDYFRMKPDHCPEEDVYVCESKYQVKNKSFKKIKMWSLAAAHVKLLAREIPLTPKRVSSVFASEHSRHSSKEIRQKVDLDEDEIAEYEAELEGLSVKLDSPPKEDGNTYFEQYTTATGCYKIGDSVYVRSDEEYPYMSRIDRIWMDSNGVPWFHGNWYLRPEEAKHMPTRMFYEQEVFQSNIEDTNPIASIMGRCCILHIKDYMVCRVTEIPERDVFICESRYDEGDGHIRKLKGIKRPSLSGLIRDDEFYYFDEPYLPKKKPSPLLMTKPALHDTDTDSLDETRKGMKRIKEQAGYALFATEVIHMKRKGAVEFSEDEFEREVKQEWRNLSGTKRAEYEARARAQGLEPQESEDGSLLVYECGWRGCNHQYEDIQDLMVHVMENGGHLVKENNEYPCLWMDCVRTKRGLLPFNTHSKLARHVREVHFKVAAKRILPSEKSRNYFPRHQAAEQSSFEHPLPFPEVQHFEDRTPSRTSLSSSDSAHLIQKPFLNRPPAPAMPLVGQMPMQPPMIPFRNITVQQPQMSQPQPQLQPPPQPQPQQRMFIQRPHPVSTAPGVGAPVQGHGQETPQGMAIQQSLTIEQQQLLIQQVQRQKQEIQHLQMQLQQAAASQQTAPQEPDSIFVPTPQSTTKLRHSEAYLRYIEGLRDNKQYLSNWSELSNASNRPQAQAQLPFHWLDEKIFGQAPATDALWALRDHMLKDAVSLSKIA